MSFFEKRKEEKDLPVIEISVEEKKKMQPLQAMK